MSKWTNWTYKHKKVEKLGAKAEDSGQIERVEWSLRMIITLYFVNCNYVRAAAGISSGRNSREE